MRLLLSIWCNLSLNITTGQETKRFTRVYANLKLLVNEEFVAYGTMVKILATLKSVFAKKYYFVQKREPVIERVYLPQYFGNKFLLS